MRWSGGPVVRYNEEMRTAHLFNFGVPFRRSPDHRTTGPPDYRSTPTMPLRFTTAGESHGPGLVSILEGMPAGLPLLAEHVDIELARRQQGYGRGRRMQIEKDQIEF